MSRPGWMRARRVVARALAAVLAVGLWACDEQLDVEKSLQASDERRLAELQALVDNLPARRAELEELEERLETIRPVSFVEATDLLGPLGTVTREPTAGEGVEAPTDVEAYTVAGKGGAAGVLAAMAMRASLGQRLQPLRVRWTADDFAVTFVTPALPRNQAPRSPPEPDGRCGGECQEVRRRRGVVALRIARLEEVVGPVGSLRVKRARLDQYRAVLDLHASSDETVVEALARVEGEAGEVKFHDDSFEVTRAGVVERWPNPQPWPRQLRDALPCPAPVPPQACGCFRRRVARVMPLSHARSAVEQADAGALSEELLVAGARAIVGCRSAEVWPAPAVDGFRSGCLKSAAAADAEPSSCECAAEQTRKVVPYSAAIAERLYTRAGHDAPPELTRLIQTGFRGCLKFKESAPWPEARVQQLEQRCEGSAAACRCATQRITESVAFAHYFELLEDEAAIDRLLDEHLAACRSSKQMPSRQRSPNARRRP